MARQIYGEWGAVTHASMHEEDGQIINAEVMPGHIVEHILDSCREIKSAGAPRSPGGMGRLVGRIPITEYFKWKREWKAGPKANGVPWKLFIAGKLNSPENSYLRFAKRV